MRSRRYNRRRFLIGSLVGTLCLLIVLGGFVYSTIRPATHAHADGPSGFTCVAPSGITCKEVFADGFANQPLHFTTYGPGGTGTQASSLDVTLRAFLYAVPNEQNDYMLFQMSVVLQPDSTGAYRLHTIGIPDTSVSGDDTTMHIRLWSTGRRLLDCLPTHPACLQQNNAQLENLNFSEANGGSMTWSAMAFAKNGSSFGWSETVPTYNWSVRSPASDPFSNYYNYALQDSSLASSRIQQDFMFGQWQDTANPHQFHIGYSIKAHLDNAAPLYIGDPEPVSFGGETHTATFSY